MPSPPPYKLWLVLLTGLLVVGTAGFYRFANVERKVHYSISFFVGGLVLIGVILYWWMCLPVCTGF